MQHTKAKGMTEYLVTHMNTSLSLYPNQFIQPRMAERRVCRGLLAPIRPG